MISHKDITKFIGVLMTAAVVFCILSMVFSKQLVAALGTARVAMQYESALFDTSEPMEIAIQMPEEEWEEMLDNAMAEEYYSCDVVINGQTLYNVGIRPKGNTSLSAIAMNPETDRFSLKLEFDHYVEGQTCFGLDKLILNNNYADTTNMKEAVVYDMYQYLAVDASLYNYAKISVNGEYWGVYLALEAVEDSFLLRNYGTEDGALYKPDGMNRGGGRFKGDVNSEGGPPRPDGRGSSEKGEMQGPDGRGLPEEEEMPRPEGRGFPDEREAPQQIERDGTQTPSGNGEEWFQKGERGGGFGMGGNGADLNYSDESLASYSAIWEGEVTNTGQQDHRRVVTALKNISEGTNLEEYLDVDNLLKYMAVHTFSVNLDSLSGNMAHNYYLYEYNGRLNILPWDYNLSFGGMNMGPDSGASEMINDAIDSPFQGTQFFDGLLENETYLARYHEYLEQLAQEYVLGGKFAALYERIRGQIDVLVETDPTALCSYEEYAAGTEMLYQTMMLRAESIEGQLAGTIPSTDEEQRANPENLVDASGIAVDVMGVFDRAGGFQAPAAR